MPNPRDIGLVALGVAAGAALAAAALSRRENQNHEVTKEVPVGAVIEKRLPSWADGRLSEEIFADEIKAAVYRGKNDMKIRDLCIGIIKQNNLDGRQRLQVAGAFQNWMRSNITYVLDPVRTEVFQEARVTLFEKQAGDCDDQAIALAAMLMSVGIPAKIILLSQEPDFDTKTGRFRHVFAAAIIDGKEVWLETIVPGGDFPGYQHYHTGLMRIDLSTPLLPAFKSIEAIPGGIGDKTPVVFGLSDFRHAEDYL